jgi:O-antigen ligase
MDSMPISRSLTPPFALALALLSLAWVFGGGQGTLGDTLTQLTALALLAVLHRHYPSRADWPKSALLAAVPLLLVLFYLMPLPDALVEWGYARRQLAQLLAPVIGDPGFQASLSPTASERSLFWLLPGTAMFLAALHFDKRQRRLAGLLVIALVSVGAVLGLAQKAGGLDSALYFYSNTNRGSAVGFFANNNHYAIAMAATLPLVLASITIVANVRSQASLSPLVYLLLSGIAVLFILGFMLSGSRAGLALGMLGCVLMLPALILGDQNKGVRHWLFGTLAVGLFFSLQIGIYFISQQFGADALADVRLQIFPIAGQAAQQFAPLGSGPGSFWFVFPQFDSEFLTGHVIVNHVHNDYLELWLEAGWLFAIAALLLIPAYLWQCGRVWLFSGDMKSEPVLLARAASVGLLLLLLHSAFDYPLRTTALSVLAGLLAAWLAAVETETATGQVHEQA